MELLAAEGLQSRDHRSCNGPVVIAGLDTLLEESRQPGLPELRACLRDLLGGSRARGRLVGEQSLDAGGSVRRVRFEVDGRVLSLVVKRSRPVPAQRNALVVARWLPAVGLRSGAARILGTAAERGGRYVWHVYEDLGDRTLETDRDAAAVRSAVALLGEMHMRFVRHPMLAEVRHRGGDLGAGFYSSNVSDAITCLESISPAVLAGRGHEPSLIDRLLERMWALRAEESGRVEAIVELGGPPTLLHGDLWLKNAAVVRSGGAVCVRLIDWDHAGLGPIGYDLSTFLAKLSADSRERVLALYGETVSGVWELPSRDDLNYLFETFELARLACCVLWAAFAVTDQPHASWPMQELEEADQWLAALEAVLQPA
jgi:hypothetical protein